MTESEKKDLWNCEEVPTFPQGWNSAPRTAEERWAQDLKQDAGKPRLFLNPPEVLEALGAVLTLGELEYGPKSWKDVEPERFQHAMMRHLCAYMRNPDGRDESGFPHSWHLLANVALLVAKQVSAPAAKEVRAILLAAGKEADRKKAGGYV